MWFMFVLPTGRPFESMSRSISREQTWPNTHRIWEPDFPYLRFMRQISLSSTSFISSFQSTPPTNLYHYPPYSDPEVIWFVKFLTVHERASPMDPTELFEVIGLTVEFVDFGALFESTPNHLDFHDSCTAFIPVDSKRREFIKGFCVSNIIKITLRIHLARIWITCRLMCSILPVKRLWAFGSCTVPNIFLFHYHISFH